ncbi:MAG TPA: gas vesicle protein GvpJ [Thermoanaerobaculia bacterium]|nr:gas vesicle protein GvpJ [Thermoanaerobaculia bacterium]
MTSTIEPTYRRSSGLVDVLDRVLDKGLVIAGDIRVSLAEVELLTIRIRLLVCSIDKAEQIGLDWWRNDPNLSVAARRLSQENESLREQIRRLEERVSSLALVQEKPQEEGRERRKSNQSDKQKTRGKINAG